MENVLLFPSVRHQTATMLTENNGFFEEAGLIKSCLMANCNDYGQPGQVGVIFPLQMISNACKQQDETYDGLSQQDCAFYHP